MRVLWFAGCATNYSPQENLNHSRVQTSGWVSQLREETLKHKEIELGICFNSNISDHFTENGIEYFTFTSHHRRLSDKLYDLIHPNDCSHDKVFWGHYITQFHKIINQFNPDIIEVFGSEIYLQLSAIAAKDVCPVALHLQGILSGCVHAILPPGVSKWNYVFSAKSVKEAYSNYQTLATWGKACYREKAILSSVPYVLGRTDWDKEMASILAPQAKYIYGGEMLRSTFYEPSKRQIPQHAIITSTISAPAYKGFDVILKTANVLKNDLHVDFTWNVYGNVSTRLAERVTGLHHENLNVKLMGIASAPKLKEGLLNSTLYFHPSYIDNSPNSLCEAQILGLPVVASNVGGINSLVKDGETGYIFPVTDPYIAAYYIKKLILDKNLNTQIGVQSKEEALQRHNINAITQELLDTYNKIKTQYATSL